MYTFPHAWLDKVGDFHNVAAQDWRLASHRASRRSDCECSNFDWRNLHWFNIIEPLCNLARYSCSCPKDTVTYRPIAKQRLQYTCSSEHAIGAAFYVDHTTTRCWVIQHHSTREDGVFYFDFDLTLTWGDEFRELELGIQKV
jgi:hypothetical protein